MNPSEFLIFTVRPQSPDQLAGLNEQAMNIYSCDGVEEFSVDEQWVDDFLGERAYSGGDVPESVLDEVDQWRGNQVNFYFYEGDFFAHAESFEKYLISESFSYKKSVQVAQDWNEEWKKGYRPIVVSENLSVLPQWFCADDIQYRPDQIGINPGMGFGTGEHETTFLCLKLFCEIENQLPEKALALDFGCGSGILGIVGIKRRDLIVDFCDIDPKALDNCLDNIRLNLLEERLNGHRLIRRDRFVLDTQYELVFANILEHVLLSEKVLLINSVKANGYLILSGILNHQVENILQAYSEKFEMNSVVSKGDWSAILLKKK